MSPLAPPNPRLPVFRTFEERRELRNRALEVPDGRVPLPVPPDLPQWVRDWLDRPFAEHWPGTLYPPPPPVAFDEWHQAHDACRDYFPHQTWAGVTPWEIRALERPYRTLDMLISPPLHYALRGMLEEPLVVRLSACSLSFADGMIFYAHPEPVG